MNEIKELPARGRPDLLQTLAQGAAGGRLGNKGVLGSSDQTSDAFGGVGDAGALVASAAGRLECGGRGGSPQGPKPLTKLTQCDP